MTRIEIDGRVWTGDDLPEHVKLEDVRKAIEQGTEEKHWIILKGLKLGDTVNVRIPTVFKPSDNLFDGIIGLDRSGFPIREPDPTIAFTWTENVPKPQALGYQEGGSDSL